MHNFLADNKTKENIHLIKKAEICVVLPGF